MMVARPCRFITNKLRPRAGNEVLIVYRYFISSELLLTAWKNKSQTEADRDRNIYYLCWRFSDSLKWLGSTYYIAMTRNNLCII